MSAAPSIHASCVLVGAGAVLIRGESGSGKSRLAMALLQAAERGDLPFARLISDDRTLVEAAHGRLIARAAPALSGLLEVRQIGILEMPVEPVAVVVLVVDIAETATRLPEPSERTVEIAGIALPRLTLARGTGHLPQVLAEISELADGRSRAALQARLLEK
jgi:serine kinase of HPr protein (carbohydrate metabolism regulator)